MSCEERGPDLVARALAQLEPQEAASLEAHLAACAPCAEEAERVARDLRHRPADLEPSADSLPRLLDAIHAEAADRRAEAALARSRVCEGRGDDVVAAALGQLEGAEAGAVREHLDACAACAAEFEGAQRLAQLTREWALATEPPADGAARVVSAARAQSAHEETEGLRDVPMPVRRARSSGRLRRLASVILPAAAAAAVLVALATGGGSTHTACVLEGTGSFVAASAREGEPSRAMDSTTGSFAFDPGDEIEAGAHPVRLHLGCEAEARAGADGMPGPGVVELSLHPGARLRRLSVAELELLAGSVSVNAGPLENPFTLRRGPCHAIVRGTRFQATTVEERLVVVVEEGKVELGRTGGPEPRAAVLSAGEEGLVDAERLLRRQADGRLRGDGFLTPRASLRARPDDSAVDEDDDDDGAPVLEAELATGEGGAVNVLGFDDSEPRFLVRLKGLSEGAPSHEISAKVLRAMLAAPPPPGRTWRLSADRPYRLSISLAGLGLSPGTWEARLRYIAYRSRATGAEWLGAVESEPVRFEVEGE